MITEIWKKKLHIAISSNGIDSDIEEHPIFFSNTSSFAQGYDPRITQIGNRYYITWCNAYHGPTIGMAYTDDFETFYQLENAFLPFNRNGVLFPEKIHGSYAILSRPSDNGHTPFGDIFYSESPDLNYWGNHKHVLKAQGLWSWTKVGAGPVPIRIDEGWLLLYHGVQTTCNGLIYSMGGAILDYDQPWKVLYRSVPYLLNPRTSYECVGDVPNVVFPCAALHEKHTGRIAIYYGAADTVVALAFAQERPLVEFIIDNSELSS